ncbi:MAG: glycosyl hydrolase, partial [Betaproteobacteria bacterium]|nr:glycosyl hydrolase [Betaproteobacteria bacterium]
TMVEMSGTGGMIPEQVWDSAAIPGRRLYPGRPSGSAMPLAWAHAEYIKLLASHRLGHPFDRPDATWERYHGIRPVSEYVFWLPQAPVHQIYAGNSLFIALHYPGLIHWGTDGWQHPADTKTTDSGLGLHFARIATNSLTSGQKLDFTFLNLESKVWADRVYSITVVDRPR